MLELKEITKDYYVDKKPFQALKGVSLYFPKQQFCSILGASGSGKTTTLNIIGGLDKYSSGDLLIEGLSTKTYDDKDWDNYRNKRIGFIFQSYNLIPQLSLQDNVSMSLTLDGVSKRERSKKARLALDAVGLKGLYNKIPNQLSGGQMQRVAIARALINDPEIILADEPTGALDSVTSVQIMDLLKEISKDKLVIMVTHNRELAEKYSDRIIEFKDGLVIRDTFENQIQEIKVKEEKEYEKNGLSLKDFALIDEKKRKKLKKAKRERKSSMSYKTSLDLSFKNLLTKKGRTIMTSVAGSFGIIGVALVLSVNNGFGNYINKLEVQTASQMPLNVSSYSVTYKKDPNFVPNEAFTDKEVVLPYLTDTGEPEVSFNNITPKYIAFLESIKNQGKIMSDYIVSYGEQYAFNLTTQNPGTKEYYQVKNGNFLAYSDMISSLTGLPTNYFHILYGDENAYDVIGGRYADPNNMHEMMLMVDNRNQIPLEVLKELGFYDKENDEITDDYAKENPVTFNEILNKTFKVFPNSEYYTEEHKEVPYNDKDVYYYKQNDLETLFNDSTKGVEVKIVGILRPKEDTTIQTMAAGVCYQKPLQDHLVELNKKDNIYQNIKNNVTWKDGANASELATDLLKLAQSLSNANSSNSSSVQNEFNNLMNKYFEFYSIFDGNTMNEKNIRYTIKDYMTWCKTIGADIIDEELKFGGLNSLQEYIEKVSSGIGKFALTQDKKYLIEIYPYLISLVGYMDGYSDIRNVIIFPVDLSSKQKLTKLLDEFNVVDPTDVPNHAKNESEIVRYTDIVGTFTGGMTQLIDILSIVLIVFASISLVVSCVMTGIITYVSVIERTKEIGILRALGARKKDVGRLFEAECVFIGLGSGLIGCFVAFVATFPINAIINHLYPEYNIGNIADLHYSSIIILVLVSCLLTFLSSLMPARAAARKDPVIALRSE